MARLKRHIYHIFIDSSALYGEPIAKQVLDFISKYKDDDRVGIKIFIPEVVAKELERRVILEVKNKHKQAVKSLKSLQVYFPELQSSLPENYNDEEIIEAKNRILAELGIEVVGTPTDDIDWGDIINRATSYYVPFEVSHEKGFKDALIVETAINHFRNSSKKMRYAFVCNDDKMTLYFNEKASAYNKLGIFDSISSLDSDIQLRLDESTEKIADNLKTAAQDAFYNPQDASSIFITASIEARINNELNKLIASHEFQSRYPTVTIQSHSLNKNIKIVNPKFVKRPNKTTFHWNSVLRANAQVVISNIEPVTQEVTLRMEYAVEWHAEFTKKGAIQKNKAKVDSVRVDSYDLELNRLPTSSSTSLEEAIRRLSGVSQLTFQPTSAALIAQAQRQAHESHLQLLDRIRQITSPKKEGGDEPPKNS